MYFKKVKIVATLGPATHSEEKIYELGKTGVDVFRINFSHATPDEAAECFKWIRSAEARLGRTFAVLGDLPGPKIRIGDVEENTILESEETLTIFTQEVMGSPKGFSINYPAILQKIEKGAVVYIDDGNIKLIITGKDEISGDLQAKVLVGGDLKPRKGFSAEGIALDKVELSDKDKIGIETLIKLGTDMIAVSFVQDASDILRVKALLPKDSPIMLMAKIETANGVENAESILDVADSIMVARGDLGLAVPFAKVPRIQKNLIELCVRKAKPVLTATQMLESMINKPLPTRAEVTDVANAILDGTDAVMLSAETAEGKFPIETIEAMVKIIHEVQSEVKSLDYHADKSVSYAISASVGHIADQIGAKCLLVFTESGISAKRISRHRHPEVIIAASDNLTTLRQLNLSWGVYPHATAEIKNFDAMLSQAKDIAKTNPIHPLKTGEQCIIVAGMPFGQVGSTNMILVEKV